jgi:hypothetical protein
VEIGEVTLFFRKVSDADEAGLAYDSVTNLRVRGK